MDTKLSHELFSTLFTQSLSQAEKIKLIDDLFHQDTLIEKEYLNELINQAVAKKDIHILGYCLALDNELTPIENKEDLFLTACKNEFINGMQLLSTQIDLEKQYQSSTRHPDSSQSLLNHALTYAIEHSNPKAAIRFLINKGADINFDHNQLFVYAYENNYMAGISYLITEQNINENIIKKITKKESDITKVEKIKKMFTEHQFNLTQNSFVMKELPANVTRHKI